MVLRFSALFRIHGENIWPRAITFPGVSPTLSCQWVNCSLNFFPRVVTAPSGVLDVTVVYVDPDEHCCVESSDDESSAKDGLRNDDPSGGERRWSVRHSLLRESTPEASSGYSSINSASPTCTIESNFNKATSARFPHPAKDKGPSLPPESGSCLHYARTRSDRRQAKRKNVAEYKEEERMNLGFLTL